MPLAHTKKILSNDIQVHGTYGIFNTANKKQYDDSTELPAILHGLSTSNTIMKNPDLYHFSTPNCVPNKSPTRKNF